VVWRELNSGELNVHSLYECSSWSRCFGKFCKKYDISALLRKRIRYRIMEEFGW
jgi:hypothetical protein